MCSGRDRGVVDILRRKPSALSTGGGGELRRRPRSLKNIDSGSYGSKPPQFFRARARGAHTCRQTCLISYHVPRCIVQIVVRCLGFI